TGAGDDAVTVYQTTPPIQVVGGTGTDVVTANVKGDPAQAGFANLSLNGGVEKLIVNNAGYPDTPVDVQPYAGDVSWRATPAGVFLGTSTTAFINTNGAGTTAI